LDGIHGPHAALHHGEADQPGVVFGGEVLDARVGDEIVFRAAFLRRIGEVQRLIRHHAEIDRYRTGFGGDAHRAVAGLGRRGIVIAAAADKQERLVGPDAIGPDDGEPVLPDRPVNVLFGAPRLGSKLEDVRLKTVAGDGADQIPP